MTDHQPEPKPAKRTTTNRLQGLAMLLALLCSGCLGNFASEAELNARLDAKTDAVVDGQVGGSDSATTDTTTGDAATDATPKPAARP